MTVTLNTEEKHHRSFLDSECSFSAVESSLG